MNRHRRTRPFLALSTILVFLEACTVGPDYQPPEPRLPDHWAEPAPAPGEGGGASDLRSWWRNFHDPVLDRLVETALAGNLDLKMAAQRIEVAKADRDATEAADLPQLNAVLSAANSRSSETLAWPPGNGAYKTYQYGLEASWEIDLFGGNRRAVEAAEAEIGATVEDRRAAQVALLGELAADYATLRSSQHRIDILRDNIAVERKVLTLAERAFAAGLGTEMDVARARAAVETSESLLPPLDGAIARMAHAIAVLSGRLPEEVTAELGQAPKAPLSLPDLPAALPSEVVRNRPDIRRAERRIAAATARVGVATAALFPHFAIPLGITPMASSLSALASAGSLVWTFGAAAGQMIYDGGRTDARIRAAAALAEHDRLAYQQTVLAAFREIEDRLSGLATERRRHEALVAAAADERFAVEQATRLYAGGLTGFLRVLDSERARLQAEDSVAQSMLAQQFELIGLYRALGGGWQEEGMPVPGNAYGGGMLSWSNAKTGPADGR